MSDGSNDCHQPIRVLRVCLAIVLSVFSFTMNPAVVLSLSLVLLAEYGSGNTIRNEDATSAAKPMPVEAGDVANNLATPSIVALQAPGTGYPTRQCAGIGQAVS